MPEALLDQLATPVLLLDAGGRVRHANPACCAWLVVSARRLLDQPLAALSPHDGALAALLERVRGAAQPASAARVRLAPTPDAERHAEATLSPLAGVDGAAWLLELHPIDEFGAPDALSAVPAALHESLKGLAHEVRNPLAGLRGAAQLLARRIDDPDARRYLDVITAESDRLTALVDRLLKPEPAGAQAETNVHEVLERVRLLAEADAGWSAVVQRDYDPSLPEVVADPDRLVQAVWNLVRNALEADASEVRLRTRVERNVPVGDDVARLAVRIEVADNGHGVDDALATRVFLPLVSGRADGTGLGLTLAQAVAREHRGTLTFRSRPGHTVFTLLLPVEEKGL
ncbi:MAG TPA: nitrogen regulation protein NR(II), partial [Xanthomonadales bacterium]|nr:nitrogen regulation protein NR(II) [Xanthomonadales bacterium]